LHRKTLLFVVQRQSPSRFLSNLPAGIKITILNHQRVKANIKDSWAWTQSRKIQEH
ncbi:unnamed protein product, partial [Allacma fusca]